MAADVISQPLGSSGFCGMFSTSSCTVLSRKSALSGVDCSAASASQAGIAATVCGRTSPMAADSGVAAVSTAVYVVGSVTVAAQLHKNRQAATAEPAANLCMALPFLRHHFYRTNKHPYTIFVIIARKKPAGEPVGFEKT